MFKKDVKIRINSHISDLILSDAYSEARTINMINNEMTHKNNKYDPSEKLVDDYMEEAVNDKIEFSTYGTLTDDGTEITISYDESELIGLEGCSTSLMFAKHNPDIVTMTRTGSVVTGIVFNPENKRHFAAYETEFMPLEFCIYTNTVKNELNYDSGGTLKLDYDIEIHGVRTERNRFKLEVSNVNNMGVDYPECR